MKFYIEIPFVKAPKSPIKISQSVFVDKVMVGDFWDGNSNNVFNKKNLLGKMYGYEIGPYLNIDFKSEGDLSKIIKNKHLAVITFNKTDEERALAFFYLLILETNHWRYILKRTNRQKLPTEFNGPVLKFFGPTIYSFTDKIKNNLKSNLNKLYIKKIQKRFITSSHLWFISLTREENLDVVRDCVSSIEGILETTGSLNLSFKVFCYLEDRKSFAFLHKINSLRNDYVHGKKIPEVKNTEVRKIIYYNYLCLKKYSNGNKPIGMHDTVVNFVKTNSVLKNPCA